MKRAVSVVYFSVCVIWTAVSISEAFAADSAVVLLYHRFGEDQFASTNISVDLFEAHIAELKTGGYTVLPLGQIVSAIADGRPLPDRTVAISIDDAFASTYEVAWPRLRAAGMAFTVFVSTEPVDQRLGGYMSWDQIRELDAAGVTIGHHTRSHFHMAELPPLAFRNDLNEASERFAAELGEVPSLLAYPFGETGLGGMEIARDLGFAAAFGQHSGVLHESLDAFYLPRFAMTGRFSSVERLTLAASSLAMPIQNLSPVSPKLDGETLDFIFDLTDEFSGVERLACFVSGRGEVALVRSALTVQVKRIDGLSPGRTRINCTMPAGEGRFRWLGMQYYVSKRR